MKQYQEVLFSLLFKELKDFGNAAEPATMEKFKKYVDEKAERIKGKANTQYGDPADVAKITKKHGVSTKVAQGQFSMMQKAIDAHHDAVVKAAGGAAPATPPLVASEAPAKAPSALEGKLKEATAKIGADIKNMGNIAAPAEEVAKPGIGARALDILKTHWKPAAAVVGGGSLLYGGSKLFGGKKK